MALASRVGRRIVWVLCGIGLFVSTVEASDGAPSLVAAQIGTSPPVGWALDGPDRDWGVGDWALGNGVVCAAITDPSHEGMLYPGGGVLVDVGLCGRFDDQWSTLETMWNLSRGETLEVREVEAGVDLQSAWVRTRGKRDGILAEAEYAVGLEEPRALRLRLTLTREAEGPRFSAASLITLHPSGQVRPFAAFRRAPEKSVGFAFPESDPSSMWSMLQAILPIDLHVFVGADGVDGVAYGLDLVRAERHRPDGTSDPLPMMAVTGADSSVTGVFTEPFWLGSGVPPGLVELAQTVFMDLEVGARVEVEWRLWVGDRADVASVTDLLWPEAPVLRGAVDDPAARIHIERPGGQPVTQVRADEDGSFAARLEPGRYTLRVRSPGRPEEVREIRHPSSGPLPEIRLAAQGRLDLPRGARMRLVFEGRDGTKRPVFGDPLLGFRLGDQRVPGTQETSFVALAGVDSDPAHVSLPAGRYRVTATRGPEFSVESVDVEVRAGGRASLDIPEPRRVVETAGWVSADLHVHSGRSFDTAWTIEDQLRAFAAEGAEVLVASEHDRVVDPVPVLRSLGLDDVVLGVGGVEITSVAETDAVPHTFGHLNAFPFERSAAYRGGAPRGEGRRLREVLGDVRSSGAFSQLNHPRSTGGRAPKGAFFEHLGVPGEPFDPSRSLRDEPNRVLLEPDDATGLRDLDFDAIEGMNGADPESYRAVREDWFALLRAGERRLLTANSDSHRAAQPPGLPRTYVRVAGGDGRPTVETVLSGLRAGRAYGTTGPLLDVRLGRAGLGDTHEGRQGVLRVEVDAAPWVPVDQVRVFVDGVVVAERAIQAGVPVEVPLEFESDAFVTVEVGGPTEEVYARIAPGFAPFAFTNPIYVDADGDGRWRPPLVSGE